MIIQRIFSLLDKRKQKQSVIVFAAYLLMGVLELVGVGSIGPFISIASSPAIIHTNKYLSALYEHFNFTSDNSFIITCGVCVIIILCVSNVSLAGINFVNYYFSARCRHSIGVRLFEKYLRQPYVFFLNVNTATISNRLLGEVNNFVNSVLLSSLQLISASIISLFIIVLLVLLNPFLALSVSVVLAACYLFIFAVVRKYIAKKGRENVKYDTLKYKYINESFGGIKDVKIMGKEKVFIDLFSGPSLKYARNSVFGDLANELPRFLVETVALSGIILVIIFMIKSGQSMGQFLPVLTIYAFGAYRLLPNVQKMYRAFSSIRFHTQAVDDLTRDLNGLPDSAIASGADVPRMPFSGSIELSGISFSYPNTDKNVIRNQSISIKHNSSVALVGATGCGKTTLADIILGLLEPQMGKIVIDGTEVTNANIKSWQKNLGYVPQNIYLTDDTVKNNIAFGIEPDEIDDVAVENAAKMANIHHFIVEELKEDYNTLIGERGIRLSGGQRQRIGIARAIYHDPSVLILDEATSALDSLTESAIMDAIGNLSSKKTIIMIAHRITTVKSCDVIYMMERGVIVDSGNYGELYERNAVFRRLADGK
ncbi:MAG: ABC transporter ATP-binding protein [Treponematales bacterium]